MTLSAIKILAVVFSLGMGTVALKQRQVEQTYRMNRALKLETIFRNRVSYLRVQLGQMTSSLKAREAAEKFKWSAVDPRKKVFVFKEKIHSLPGVDSTVLPELVSRY